MRDDYLWDGSGEPDPEIQKLEKTLGRLRHNRPAPVFPQLQPQTKPRFWQRHLFPYFAAAAAAAVVVAAVSIILFRPHTAPALRPGWDVTRISGTPQLGTQKLVADHEEGKFRIGQVLETDGQSKANLRLEELGEIEVEPNTILRLPDSSSGVNRLAMDRGTIQASIWAPAGEFVVDTPSAVAVDLGCTYRLHVDDSGNGVLHTTMGWVGFKLGDREAFIPAGAACSTRRNTGPGTPYFEDSSEAFRSALSRFDESSTAEQRSGALDAVLAQSRKRDSLTLWHLLARVDNADRSRVYDRLVRFVPPPVGVTREGIMGVDHNMMDLWWNQLGLGDVALWRHWERTWSENTK